MAGTAEIALQLRDQASDQLKKFNDEGAASIERFSKRGIAAYEELQREYVRMGQKTAELRQQLALNRREAQQLNEAVAAGGPGAAEARQHVAQLDAEYRQLRRSMQATRLEFSAVSQQSSAMMRENTLARENAESLAATFGVQVPESIRHLIVQSKAAQDILASLFSVTIVMAFAGAIAELGSEIYEFAEKSIEEYEGVAEAEREMKKAGEENFAQLNEGASKSSEYAKSQLVLINKQIEAQQQLVDSQFKSLDNGVKYTGLMGIELNKLTGRQAEYKKNEEGLNKLLAERDKLIAILKKDNEDASKKSEEAAKKAAEAAKERTKLEYEYYAAIHSTKVELPAFITALDRETAAIKKQENGWRDSLDILKSVQAIQKEMSETPAQMGFQVPSVPAGIINTQIEMVGKLTSAQREQLPTEEELQCTIALLSKDYPNLTNAEKQHWAQVMLTSGAFRQQIDSSNGVTNSLKTQKAEWASLSQQARTAMSEMMGQLTGWGGVAGRIFDQMFNSIDRQIQIEHQQVAEHQRAQFSMMTATLDGIKQLAPVMAIVDTAKGFEALAAFHFTEAAKRFAAAALWGTVGAFQIASMAGAFQPGSGSGSASSIAGAGSSASAGSSGGSSPALASGTKSVNAASQNQPQTLQVIFHGNIYGHNGMKEVVDKINAGVKFNRWQLVASHTITGKTIK